MKSPFIVTTLSAFLLTIAVPAFAHVDDGAHAHGLPALPFAEAGAVSVFALGALLLAAALVVLLAWRRRR